MRIKKFKTKAARDIVRSTPKVTHTRSGSGVAKSVPKSTHPGRNLGKYLHTSKLPAGGKIGAGLVKMKSRKSNKTKGY